jgi:hypothetical protein
MKYWEIIADNLKKAGWSWGCVSAIDSNGRTIWVADAHCGDGKGFVVRADEKLTAFMELEAAIRAVSGRFRQPKVILRQKTVSVSQVLHCVCDTTPNNSRHGNKTIFSKMWRSSRYRAGSAVECSPD